MAITNYTELQSALASWLDRSDLTSRIPEFIALAEDSLNKRLRIRAMENRATATVNEEYVALPTGFLEMRNFQLNTSPKQRLDFVTPENIDTFWTSSTTGLPKFYTFIGGEIQLAPAPASSYTAEMDYYKKWDIATDSTNWLLTNAPRVYLYGTLLQAEPFLKNDKRLGVWEQMFEKALAEVELADSRERHSGGSLVVRVDFTPV
jgi:hypothetical protein